MKESAEETTKERRDHGNLKVKVSPFAIEIFKGEVSMISGLTHPEVIIARRKHVGAVANHIRNQSRAKVPGQVDGITSLPAKSRTNTKDEKKQTERQQIASARVDKGVDAKHEDRATNELIPEHGRPSHERCRVGTKDTRARCIETDGSDAGPAFKGINGASVVTIDDGCAGHGAEELGDEVDGEFAPGKASKDAV